MRNSYWWCRIVHWRSMRVAYEILAHNQTSRTQMWHCHRCRRWWKRTWTYDAGMTTEQADADEQNNLMRDIMEDLRTL